MHRFAYLFTSTFLLFLNCANDSYAQTSSPLQVGDTWRYRQTSEQPGSAPKSVSTPDFSVLFQNKAGEFVLAMKRHDIANATWQLIGPISPTVCMFDVIAHEGITKNCEIRVQDGVTWATDETTSLARTQERFSVGAVEDVIVLAGKYQAVKIQVQRTVTEVAYPGVAEPPGGYVKQFKTTYWYSNDVKAMVKVIRELSTAGGKIIRQTEELESYSRNTLKQ
jgi:hypothetical protein